MNANELSNHVLRTLGDPEGDRWGVDEVMAYLDEAQEDYGDRTGIFGAALSATLNSDLTPAYAFYDLPADFSQLQALAYDGRELAPMPIAQLEGADGWRTETGEPSWYILGPWGYRTIRLYPYPSASAAADLSGEYLKSPASMSETTTPAIPQVDHMALVYKAVSLAYLKDFEAKDPAKAANYEAMYERKVAKALARSARGHDRMRAAVPFSNV